MTDTPTMQATDMRDIRKALGISQEDLAKTIGMSRKAVNQMERGIAPIERRTELSVRYIALLQELGRPLP